MIVDQRTWLIGLFIFISFLVYHFVIRIWLHLRFYESQGVVLTNDVYFPVLGSVKRMLPWYQAALDGSGDRTVPNIRLVQEVVAPDGIYDSTKVKACMVVFMSFPVLSILDPEMVQQVFSTQNNDLYADKTGRVQYPFEDLIGHSFLFSKGDKKWETVRKACSQAFYKDRLQKMMLVLKDKLQKWVDERHKEILDSKDGRSIVDISLSLEKLFSRNIVHIILGEDISDTLIEIDICKDWKKSQYERQKLCLPEAISKVAHQCHQTIHAKIGIEGRVFFRKVTGIKNVTRFEKTTEQNAIRIRAVVIDYVRRRKSGERQSNVKDGADLLSLFLQNQEVFNDELIVDEILDFFFAGTITSQYATQTAIINLTRQPGILKKLRDEFQSHLEKHPANQKTGISKSQLMNEVMDVQTTQELEYLSYVIQESQRYHNSVPSTSQFHFTRDTKLYNLNIRAGDAFFVDFYALHNDASQWQNPLDFIPERFDNSNALSLTPSGKKRHPYAYVPFSGGKRICFGKTFAEATMKITVTYITQAFDMAFVDKEHQTEKLVNHFGMIGSSKIDIAFSERQ